MKKRIKGAILLPLLLLTITLSSCERDYFLEDRIVGTWENYYRDSFESEERTLTFTPHGFWTLNVRHEDYYGVTNETDMGEYEIINHRLYLYSQIYHDEQVYDIEIRNNRLYLIDLDGNETVYRKY